MSHILLQQVTLPEPVAAHQWEERSLFGKCCASTSCVGVVYEWPKMNRLNGIKLLPECPTWRRSCQYQCTPKSTPCRVIEEYLYVKFIYFVRIASRVSLRQISSLFLEILWCFNGIASVETASSKLRHMHVTWRTFAADNLFCPIDMSSLDVIVHSPQCFCECFWQIFTFYINTYCPEAYHRPDHSKH